MELLTPYWGYIFLFVVFVVLPWLAWRMLVWLTGVVAQRVERWRVRRSMSRAIPVRFWSLARRRRTMVFVRTIWSIGGLAAFAGGYGAAMLAKEYGHLDSLAWSMVGLWAALVIAKRVERPVKNPLPDEQEVGNAHAKEDNPSLNEVGPADGFDISNLAVGDNYIFR